MNGWVFAEHAHRSVALLAGHATIKTAVRVLVVLERNLNEIKMRSPAGEDDALDRALLWIRIAPLAVLVQVVEQSAGLGGWASVGVDLLGELRVETHALALVLVVLVVAALHLEGRGLVAVLADLADCVAVGLEVVFPLFPQGLDVLRADNVVARRHIADGVGDVTIVVLIIAIPL